VPQGPITSVAPRRTDAACLREAVRLLAQGVMEPKLTELTGVPRGERAARPSPDLAQRLSRAARGHPPRTDRSRDPRVRDGNYFSSLLEPRQPVPCR
jgi:hypothetical protein